MVSAEVILANGATENYFYFAGTSDHFSKRKQKVDHSNKIAASTENTSGRTPSGRFFMKNTLSEQHTEALHWVFNSKSRLFLLKVWEGASPLLFGYPRHWVVESMLGLPIPVTKSWENTFFENHEKKQRKLAKSWDSNCCTVIN